MCANKLLITEKDHNYCSALAKAIANLSREIDIRVNKLDTMAAFEEYDLILSDGYTPEDFQNIIGDRAIQEKIVILVEERTEDLKAQFNNEGVRFWKIYKYQDLDRIISDLNFIISSITGRKKIYRSNIETSLIGLIGCSGGAGTTSLAIATSRELVRHHNQKVLYLSFEEISVSELYFDSSTVSRNISDYLYFLLEKKNEAICSSIDSFICTDEYGVETFLPAEGRNDLNLLSLDELEKFIQSIAGSRRYDHILIDLKNDLKEQNLKLIDRSSRLILIQSDDPVSKYKMEKTVKALDDAGVFHRQGNHILITNRCSEEITVGTDELEEHEYTREFKHKISVHDDKNSFRSHCMKMEIINCNSFGLGVKKIAEEILVSKN